MITKKAPSRWTLENITELLAKYRYPARVAMITGVSRQFVYKIIKRYGLQVVR